MKLCKIIHLLPSNKFSGAEHVILQIMDLFKNDTNFEMYYVSCDGPIRTILEQKKVNYQLFSKFSYKEIKKVINKIQPNIIHAHDFRASSFAACFNKKAKIISHLHVNWPWIKNLNIKNIIYALSLLRTNLVFGVSQSIFNEYIFNNFMKNKFFLLPNVLNAEDIQKKSQNSTIAPIDLLFVGRLTEQKNPIMFLEIIKTLIQKEVHVNAVMLGDGELKKDCEKYITENNLKDFITLKGFVPNPYPYMKAAKILVIPSKFEGFGLVAIEAMLLNTLVIGTSVGGLKDILIDTCSTIAKTKEEFLFEIKRLLINKNLYDKKIQSTKTKIEKYTNLPLYKEKLINYYQMVLEKNYAR